MSIARLAFVALLCSCGHAPPPPLPPPAFGALWAEQVFDCRGAEVAHERSLAADGVRACLLGDGTVVCLAELALQYQRDTLACEVRRHGSLANAEALAGNASAENERISATARKLITDGMWGFQ